MATIFTVFSLPSLKPHTPDPPPSNIPKPFLSTIPLSVAASTLVITAPFPPPPSLAYTVFYGSAASAANYGGSGGSVPSAAEYTYDVPDGWKERAVSKIEKGTNGTDSEFFNPRKRSEREYLTALSGVRQLTPIESVLESLALSDVGLQDRIAGAERVSKEEKRGENGQIYYEFEIEGGGGDRSLISVTCVRDKLYAHFVDAPAVEWERDGETLRHLHESFRTVSF